MALRAEDFMWTTMPSGAPYSEWFAHFELEPYQGATREAGRACAVRPDRYFVSKTKVAPLSKEGEPWEALPGTLLHIRQAIEVSKSLLELKEDWDEAGSPAIPESTWRRAAEFLGRHAKAAWDRDATLVHAPDISPGPAGSIDLHWNYPGFEMLINIPVDERKMAGFYGDDRGSISMKGTFEPNDIHEGLLRWLVKAS